MKRISRLEFLVMMLSASAAMLAAGCGATAPVPEVHNATPLSSRAGTPDTRANNSPLSLEPRIASEGEAIAQPGRATLAVNYSPDNSFELSEDSRWILYTTPINTLAVAPFACKITSIARKEDTLYGKYYEIGLKATEGSLEAALRFGHSSILLGRTPLALKGTSVEFTRGQNIAQLIGTLASGYRMTVKLSDATSLGYATTNPGNWVGDSMKYPPSSVR